MCPTYPCHSLRAVLDFSCVTHLYGNTAGQHWFWIPDCAVLHKPRFLSCTVYCMRSSIPSHRWRRCWWGGPACCRSTGTGRHPAGEESNHWEDKRFLSEHPLVHTFRFNSRGWTKMEHFSLFTPDNTWVTVQTCLSLTVGMYRHRLKWSEIFTETLNFSHRIFPITNVLVCLFYLCPLDQHKRFKISHIALLEAHGSNLETYTAIPPAAS